MFLSFLKKCPFNLCLNLLSEFDNFSPIGKRFQTIGVREDKLFWPEYVFLKGCFSFETKDLIFAWFDKITYMYHENIGDKFPLNI